MMIPSAASISSFVRWFCTPSAPFVSTLTGYPSFSPVLDRFSAAIKVWAIPVGHAVTARIRYFACPASLLPVAAVLFSSASISAVFSGGLFFLSPSSFAGAKRSASLSLISFKNSSAVFALTRAFLKSGSIKTMESFERASRWASASPSGAAIMNRRLAGLPSNDS